MIKINLLPYREKEKKDNLAKQIGIIAGTFILFLLCLAYAYIHFSSQVKNLESKINESRQTLKVLDAKVGDLKKFKSLKTELELKLAVIGILEENRLTPVKMLDDLAMLVPQKNIYLKKIVQNGESLTIEGDGRDNIAVADFMKIIENFDPIKTIDLVSSKKVDVAGTTLQQFNFSCKLKKGF